MFWSKAFWCSGPIRTADLLRRRFRVSIWPLLKSGATSGLLLKKERMTLFFSGDKVQYLSEGKIDWKSPREI